LDFLSRIDREGPDPLRLIVDRVALLAGLGFGPRFDICPLCGKPHKPGADAVFRSEIGGACHRECAGVFERGDVALSAGTLAIIRKALDSPDDRLKRLRLNKAAEEELRAALAQFTVVQRGDEIKSLSFLQKLGLA
jgi:recombinational DNA repair protein (RecF pathway)